jgi:site-specific recombinase XerD
MNRKRGLGQLLVRGFKKRANTKLVGFGVSFQGETQKSPSNPPSRPKRAIKTLNLSQMRSTRIPEESPQKLPLPSTSVPVPHEVVTVPEKALISSVPQVHVELAPRPFETTQSYSIQEMIKPDDRLKQSIEAFLLDQRSPHTRRAYQKDLKRFIQFLIVRKINAGFEQLNRTILIAYKESLLAEGLQHTTVDRHLATLRSFFKWLVDDGLITKSPADGVRFLNPKRISRTIGFSDEEVKKVLSVPNLHTRTGSMHYAILMILFYCGLRRSELCSLRTTNLGMERNQRVLRLRGKGNAERVIVMIPPVWNALLHYFFISRRDLARDEFLFLPLKNNRTNVVNKHLDTSMIFYIVTRYSRLAGISNRVSPHSCRATAISNARDHHVPDRAIQEFAGWASPDMITRYDKRRTSVENSAAHSISYGAEDRSLPVNSQFSETAPLEENSSPQVE